MGQCILIITGGQKAAVVINVHSAMSAFKCLKNKLVEEQIRVNAST